MIELIPKLKIASLNTKLWIINRAAYHENSPKTLIDMEKNCF